LTGSASTSVPDLPTIVGAERFGALTMPSMVVSGPRQPGNLAAWSVPLSETLTGTVSGTLPAEHAYDADREATLRGWLDAEAARLLVLGADPELDTYRGGLSRMQSAEAVGEAIQISADAGAEEQMTAGVGALSLGLAGVMEIAGTVPPQSQWDSHVGNDKLQDENFEHAFGELDTLLELLDTTSAPSGGSLLSCTTVLALSEMGRTPVHNGSNGKDHWPFTSFMLVGAGIAGGRTIGSTDDLLVGQTIDLASGEAASGGELLAPTHLSAGLLQMLGVDPGVWFPGVTPFTAPFS
jgi:uncharacterized protein (DUF1501 family)